MSRNTIECLLIARQNCTVSEHFMREKKRERSWQQENYINSHH